MPGGSNEFQDLVLKKRKIAKLDFLDRRLKKLRKVSHSDKRWLVMTQTHAWNVFFVCNEAEEQLRLQLLPRAPGAFVPATARHISYRCCRPGTQDQPVCAGEGELLCESLQR